MLGIFNKFPGDIVASGLGSTFWGGRDRIAEMRALTSVKMPQDHTKQRRI